MNKISNTAKPDQPTARLDGSPRKRGILQSLGTYLPPPERFPFPTVRHHKVRGKMNPIVRLQNLACVCPFLLGGVKSTKSRLLEHLSNTLTSSSGALEVTSVDPISNSLTLRMTRLEPFSSPGVFITYLFHSHWFLAHPLQFFIHPGIISEVHLAADQDHREAWAKMQNLRYPLHTSKLVERFHRLEHWLHTFSSTLSSESGESMAKQIRMT